MSTLLLLCDSKFQTVCALIQYVCGNTVNNQDKVNNFIKWSFLLMLMQFAVHHENVCSYVVVLPECFAC